MVISVVASIWSLLLATNACYSTDVSFYALVSVCMKLEFAGWNAWARGIDNGLAIEPIQVTSALCFFVLCFAIGALWFFNVLPVPRLRKAPASDNS